MFIDKNKYNAKKSRRLFDVYQDCFLDSQCVGYIIHKALYAK